VSAFNFSELTPDLILDAIESQDIRVESGLLALNSYENRVYQFVAEDTKRYVAKFYRPQRWSRAQIQEEHDFSIELASYKIPIIAPLICNKQSLHIYKDYSFALFPAVGGRQFEVDNLNQVECMGRFIGQIHSVSKRANFIHRPTMSVDDYLIKSLQELQGSPLIPPGVQPSFFAILQQVVDLTLSLYSSTNNIRLHGDCHPGNILWRDGPTFVDLDDCRSGPAIQDMWMMLSGDRQHQFIQMQTLVKSYTEFCEFDTNQLALIEPLRAMRMVHYMAWLARRWQDPAFPQAFPWFADSNYWFQQILSLKEQFSALQEPPLTL
jgi:Ser/Thr protein kinase RdoA (MazF antagonist)